MCENGGARDATPVSAAPPSTDWAQLYEECHEQVRRYFARHVKCPHDVDDLVQEVFAGLLTRGGRLRDPQVYVQAVARYQLCSYWRRKDKSAVSAEIVCLQGDSHPASASYCDYESDPVRQLAQREARRTVTLMMSHLSPALEEVLRLRFIDELLPAEAAVQTGRSTETLKKRLTRAKQSLAELCRTRRSSRSGGTGRRRASAYTRAGSER